MDEGKATVRLKEPAVDICLSKVRHFPIPTALMEHMTPSVFD